MSVAEGTAAPQPTQIQWPAEGVQFMRPGYVTSDRYLDVVDRLMDLHEDDTEEWDEDHRRILEALIAACNERGKLLLGPVPA